MNDEQVKAIRILVGQFLNELPGNPPSDGEIFTLTRAVVEELEGIDWIPTAVVEPREIIPGRRHRWSALLLRYFEQ